MPAKKEAVKKEAVKLPSGIDQELYNKAQATIVSGFKAKQDENAIKTALVAQGIGFSDIVRLYKHITINSGMVLSPKQIRIDVDAAIAEAVKIPKETMNEDLTFDQFTDAIEKTMATVKGATEKVVIGRIRTALATQDLEMPKKPKAKKGGSRAAGKINQAISEAFAENTDLTAEEFKAVMDKTTTEKSSKKWCRMYPLFAALANGKNV